MWIVDVIAICRNFEDGIKHQYGQKGQARAGLRVAVKIHFMCSNFFTNLSNAYKGYSRFTSN